MSNLAILYQFICWWDAVILVI